MNTILRLEEAIEISNNLQKEGKKIVLAGGCFDIIHTGHIEFLKNARNLGDTLFVLLESDETIKKIKGVHRPINPQEARARVLSSIRFVDYVVLLAQSCTNQEYDDIIVRLRPALIATTKGDKYREHKERQAQLVGTKVIDVVQPISDQSTSRIAKMLSEEL